MTQTRITFWLRGNSLTNGITVDGICAKPFNVGDEIYFDVQEITPAIANKWERLYSKNSIASAYIEDVKETALRTRKTFVVDEIYNEVTYIPLHDSIGQRTVFVFEYHLTEKI